MHDFDLAAVLSTVCGGGVVAALAKLVLDKALSDLDELTNKLEAVLIRLSAINVKLEAIDRLKTTVSEHDRQIAVLDARSQMNAEHAARRSPGARPT